jgi:hypothetical protein
VAWGEKIGRYLLADRINEDKDLPVTVGTGIPEQGLAP